MQDLDALERSQKKLYLSVKNELSLVEKTKNKEIRAYERAFYSSLTDRIKASSRSELLRAVSKSKVVFVGDFHPFRQSQKGFLRLVEGAIKPVKKYTLALECFQAKHQASIDAYLDGHITLDEAREETEFEEYWPFPWDHYRDILSFAKEKRFGVLALNIPEKGRTSNMLRQRDIAAAERIATELASRPDSRIFVLYGELHLARNHLPGDVKAILQKSASLLIVHQNEPSLYWKAPRAKSGHRVEVLKLKEDEFCILNSVPWVKLRSYLDWLEGDPSEDDLDEGIDLPGTIHEYARLLAETIKVSFQPRANLDIYGPESIFSSDRSQLFGKSSKEESLIVQHATKFYRAQYVPKTGALLVPNLSTNNISEASALLVWSSCKRASAMPDQLSEAAFLLRFAASFLGSKILNPKRKCNEVEDLKLFLANVLLKTKLAESRRRVFKRALHLLKPYFSDCSRAQHSPKLPGALEIEALRIAGYIIGQRVFSAFLREPQRMEQIRQIFNAPLEPEERAIKRLKSVLQKIAPKISRPQSKRALF